MTESFDDLYEDFNGQYLGLVHMSQFIDIMAPWNVRDLARQTCLCSPCESLHLFMEGLQVVAQLLQPVILAAERARDAAQEEVAVQRQKARDAQRERVRAPAEKAEQGAAESGSTSFNVAEQDIGAQEKER